MLAGLILIDAANGRTLLPHLEMTSTRWESTRGLLGKKTLADDAGLIIDRCGAVHTMFMRFALDLAFIDSSGLVLKAVYGVKPWWPLICARRARRVLETAVGTLDNLGLVAGTRVEIRDQTGRVV